VRPTVAVRIACALTAAVALLSPTGAGAATRLRAQLHAALAGFDGRGTGVLAVDLASGRVV